VTRSEKLHLRAEGFLWKWRSVTAEAKLAKRTNDLRQADKSARRLEETLLSERRHSRKKVGFLRWHLLAARAILAKNNASLDELVEMMEERNNTINVLRKRDTKLEIPHGGDIVTVVTAPYQL
jgi:hypothetical protein